MKAKDEHLIERFLAGDMTTDEKSDMENRLQNEPDLRQELMQYELAISSLKLAQREELKARFRDRDKMLDKGQQVHKLVMTRNDFWVLAVAALVLVLLAFQFLMPRHEPELQSQVNPMDTITTDPNQVPVLAVDTTKNMIVEPKPDMAENKTDRKTKTKKERGEELYAANFEPYRDDIMDPTSRSGDEGLTDLEKFQVSYWEGRYKEAAAGFEKLAPEYADNLNFRFMYAMALMQVNRSSEAAVILKEIRKDPELIYFAEATYYMALYEIRQGSFETAKKLLTEYIAYPEATQKERAKKLLTGIKE